MRHDAARQRSHHEAPDAPDLARLVADAAAGEEAAWESLVRLYGRRIYAMAKSRLRDADAAEEIAQSVFATLAAKLRDGESQRYQEEGKFEPWLFRITMNRVRDEGRRRQRRGPTVFSLADADRPAAAPEPDNTPDTDLHAMRAAIQTLDSRDREIVELRHHAALSFAQIAETLGEPMGTVLARHHRALKKLRTRIEAATGHADIEPAPHAADRAAGGTNHA
jgi:RNA polymerase sigma-70 factor (ECF subfamily)